MPVSCSTLKRKADVLAKFASADAFVDTLKPEFVDIVLGLPFSKFEN
jgi:hypothetical protein